MCEDNEDVQNPGTDIHGGFHPEKTSEILWLTDSNSEITDIFNLTTTKMAGHCIVIFSCRI